jgi:ankyrin repeat protein
MLTCVIITGLQNVAETHRDITQEQLDIQQDAVKQAQREKEKECYQLFRLTKSTEDATYEWYKDRVEDRVQGTCQWFLKHNYFQEWLKQKSGPLLVSADPGCGKSVLAKYLIDHVLPIWGAVCYFFFKDQDQNTIRQALCALLHQLFSQKPFLIRHALKPYENEGPKLINSTRSLWTILENTVQDPQAGPVIVVLDALDECAESEYEGMMRSIESQFRRKLSEHFKLKYLLTSRPYEQIVSKFWGLLGAFPHVRIPGEEESETISEEVNHVIRYRVERLAKCKGLSDKVKGYLADRLLKITHRTYLWVYLVFDYIETEGFKKTAKGVDHTIDVLPKSVNEAYEQILNKSKEHSMVRKALSIILVAARPLTLSEMNVAMNIDHTLQSVHDIDLEEEEDFKPRLRSWCGLFVSIYHGRVYFLHQTARQFLLADPPSYITTPTKLQWHQSITHQHAHSVLAELCVRYLDFFNLDDSLLANIAREDPYNVDFYTLLDYSTQFWISHFYQASINHDDISITPLVLRISNPDGKAYSVWFHNRWKRAQGPPRFPTALTVASHFRLRAAVKLLLEGGADLESIDEKGRTALLLASENGDEDIIRLLLEGGADIERKDEYGWTPLSLAVRNRDMRIMKLLLEKGANIESKVMRGWTPLSFAIKDACQEVIKLLLEKGADLEPKDQHGRTPLSLAAENGDEATIKLLVEKGADLESKDEGSQAPLLLAAKSGFKAAVKLLLEKGANLESKDGHGWTPLLWAVKNRHEAVVEILLKKGANVGFVDNYGRTPLSLAADHKYEAIAKILLEKYTNIELRDEHGQTPLLWAASHGYKAITKLLLEKRADIEAKDEYSKTPLSLAARNGDEGIVTLLLKKGARPESKDNLGRTPLSLAASYGREVIAKRLLMEGASLESKDDAGRTPLSWAAEYGYDSVVLLLLKNGADIEQEDEYGWTPLSLAVKNRHVATTKLILDNGAKLESQDKQGRTPLLLAVESGHIGIIEQLLTSGSNIESKDRYGVTPLSLATKRREGAVVKLLLKNGAILEPKDVESKDVD